MRPWRMPFWTAWFTTPIALSSKGQHCAMKHQQNKHIPDHSGQEIKMMRLIMEYMSFEQQTIKHLQFLRQVGMEVESLKINSQEFIRIRPTGELGRGEY